MNNLDWDDIRFFLELTRHHTLSAAAGELNVSHVTVARRVNRMEESLGHNLFEKRPGEFALTKFGEELVDHAQDVESAVLHLRRTSSAHDERIEGKVRLTIGCFLGMLLGMPMLAALRKRHPELEVELIEGPDVIDLGRGEADVAIRIQLRETFPGGESQVVRRLGRLDWAFFGSEKLIEETGVEQLDRVDDLPLVLYSDLAPGKMGSAWLEGRGTPRVIATSNSAFGVAGAGISGAGFAPCPVPFAEFLGLRQVSEVVDTSYVFVGIHPDMRRSARVRAVADFTYEYCLEHPELFGTSK